MPRDMPPQSPDWGVYDIKSYTSGTIYILDYDEQDAQQEGRSHEQRLHDERCAKLVNFFMDRTDYKIEAISFARGSTMQDWRDCVARIKDGKTEDDLVFVFYDGKAFGVNEHWHFKFQRNLRVNAYDFVRNMHDTGCDVLMRLQCAHNSRLRWEPHNDAMTDILYGSLGHYDGSGHLMDHDGDWVNSFVRTFERFFTDPKEFVSHQHFWNYSLKTIGEMMRSDETVNDNVDHYWSHRPDKKRKKIVRRLAMDPAFCARTGKLKFYGKQISPLPPHVAEIPHDEGIGMDEDGGWEI